MWSSKVVAASFCILQLREPQGATVDRARCSGWCRGQGTWILLAAQLLCQGLPKRVAQRGLQIGDIHRRRVPGKRWRCGRIPAQPVPHCLLPHLSTCQSVSQSIHVFQPPRADQSFDPDCESRHPASHPNIYRETWRHSHGQPAMYTSTCIPQPVTWEGLPQYKGLRPCKSQLRSTQQSLK